MQPEPEGEPIQEIGMTHREIAERLGIGRARVFYHEKEALKKIKRALERAGIRTPGEFDFIALPREGQGAVLLKPLSETPPLPRFSSLHGWLRVDRIVSINVGSELVEDVVRAFRFLKQEIG